MCARLLFADRILCVSNPLDPHRLTPCKREGFPWSFQRGKVGVPLGPEHSDKGAIGRRITIIDPECLLGPPQSCDFGALAAMEICCNRPVSACLQLFDYASERLPWYCCIHFTQRYTTLSIPPSLGKGLLAPLYLSFYKSLVLDR